MLLMEGGKILMSNQVRFDENLYPYRNHIMVEQNLIDIAELDIVTADNRLKQRVQMDQVHA